MLKRGNALAALPRDPYTALLLTSFPAVRYYAGKEAAEGSALLAWSGGCILLPSFSSEKKSGFAQIRRALPKTVSTLEAEPSALTAADWTALRDALPIAALSEDLERRVFLQRCRKNPEEIQKIRQAQQITERAFTACLNDIRPGMTDRELQKRIADHLWAEGSEMTSFNHVLGCGPDTVNPHVRPTGRRIARGDLIMMDIGAQVEGYGSDMTRMIAVGEPGEEERRIYELVLAAQTAGIAAVQAGIACLAVDRAARTIIEQAGYGSFFTHGLGHPVGSGGWEGPRFAPGDDTPLPTDIVMTVEPGIYLPGQFGIRIEDMILVRKDGIENLTALSHQLIIL